MQDGEEITLVEFNTPGGVKKPAHDQQWRQAKSIRFESYEAARAAYDASKEERRRIRARTNGKFDFVVYERLPTLSEKKQK